MPALSGKRSQPGHRQSAREPWVADGKADALIDGWEDGQEPGGIKVL